MFIKKVEICNFKAFADNVTLNLSPNNNKIENDVDDRYFKKVNDAYLSKFASISSANARGKTSILQAIILFNILFKNLELSGVYTLSIPNYFFNSFPVFFNLLDSYKTNDISNKLNSTNYQKILTDLLNEAILFLNNKKFTLYDFLINDINNLIKKELEEVINKWLIDNSLVNDNDLLNSLLTLMIEIIYKGIVLQFKQEWYKNKHFKEKKTIISLLIYDGNQDILINFEDYWLDNNNISYEKIMFKPFETIDDNIKKYLSNIYSFNPAILIYDNIIFNNLRNFTEDNEKYIDIVTSLLKVSDINIEEVIFKNELQPWLGINRIVNTDGTTITWDQLSSGTIRFLDIVSYILSSYKNKNCLFLIDEIDTYLHNDLINFLKQLIRLSDNEVQLIFTSHNLITITENISPKQMFFIKDDEESKRIIKVSSVYNANKDPLSGFMKKIIGSFPNEFYLDNLIMKIIS